MGKFRLRLKLQGFEVEIDGEREDLPAIREAVQHQIGGLVDSVEIAASVHKQIPEGTGPVLDGEAVREKARTTRKRGGSRSSAEGAGQAIEFRHDSAKYGNPLQTWSVPEKCVWLLFVIKNLTETKEVSGPDLAATFNQHFKTAGRVHPPIVSRELAKSKVLNPAPIGEDKGKWFLTLEGERQAQELVQNLLNGTNA